MKITAGPEGTVNTPNVSFSFVVEGAPESGTVFHCALDHPVMEAPCKSPFALGPLAPGCHSFYINATNEAANAYSPLVVRTFGVAAPGGSVAGCTGSTGSGSTGSGSAGSGSTGSGSTGSGVGQGAPSTLAPTVSALRQSTARWREGTALAHTSQALAKPPRGTTFSFTLNEAAAAHLSFTQTTSGRSVGGRCVAQTTGNRGKRACRRTITAGALTLQGHAGSDHVRFEGRVSSAKRLKPGRYTLVLRAIAGGLTSAPRSLTFTIVS